MTLGVSQVRAIYNQTLMCLYCKGRYDKCSHIKESVKSSKRCKLLSVYSDKEYNPVKYTVWWNSYLGDSFRDYDSYNGTSILFSSVLDTSIQLSYPSSSNANISSTSGDLSVSFMVEEDGLELSLRQASDKF